MMSDYGRLAKEGKNCDNEPELIYLGVGSKERITGYINRPSVNRKAARRQRKVEARYDVEGSDRH